MHMTKSTRDWMNENVERVEAAYGHLLTDPMPATWETAREAVRQGEGENAELAIRILESLHMMWIPLAS